MYRIGSSTMIPNREMTMVGKKRGGLMHLSHEDALAEPGSLFQGLRQFVVIHVHGLNGGKAGDMFGLFDIVP